VRSTARGPIVEVPPLVADRFGQVIPMGWGWGLRMSAPARVLREIDRANQMGRPAVLTIHPWELDPDPPRVPLPSGLRFAHYFRLGRLPGTAAHDSARAPRSVRFRPPLARRIGLMILLPRAMMWFGSSPVRRRSRMPRVALQDPVDDDRWRAS
jgi:hypothetical protein